MYQVLIHKPCTNTLIKVLNYYMEGTRKKHTWQHDSKTEVRKKTCDKKSKFAFKNKKKICN